MNIALWIVQVLRAPIILSHGRLLLQTTPSQARPTMPYILAIPPAFRRFLGVAEILAGIGLVLPALTNILPWLTPLAAAALVIMMFAAVIWHISHKETPNIVFNLILL